MNTLPIHLCDACRAPGQCCKGFVLNRAGVQVTLWDDVGATEQLRAHGLPFHAIEKTGTWVDETTGRSYSTHRYACDKLLPNGRCGAYEQRPSVCRTYAAGENALCAMFVPPS